MVPKAPMVVPSPPEDRENSDQQLAHLIHTVIVKMFLHRGPSKEWLVDL